MINDDLPFDDFDAEPAEGWRMFRYDSARVGGQDPHMAYAWEVWLDCKAQGEPVPEEIQARVDEFCHKEATKAVQSIPKKDDARVDSAFKEYYIHPTDERLVEAVDNLAPMVGGVATACHMLAQEWIKGASRGQSNGIWSGGGIPHHRSIRTEYYAAKKRLKLKTAT